MTMQWAKPIENQLVPFGLLALEESELQEFTSDLQRFIDYLPYCLELTQVSPCTPEAREVFTRVNDLGAMQATAREVAAIFFNLGNHLIHFAEVKQ